MNNKRKLIGSILLQAIIELPNLGVPTKRIIENKGLDVSGSHLTKLIEFYKMAENSDLSTVKDRICSSIFPPWLNDTDKIKEVPDNWKYKDHFPFGYWEINAE